MRFLLLVIAIFIIVRPCDGQIAAGNKNEAVNLKTISFHAKNETIEQVLFHLTEKYHLDFSYAGEMKSLQDRTSISVHKLPLENALERLLSHSGIAFTIVGSHIILKQGASLMQASVNDSISLNEAGLSDTLKRHAGATGISGRRTDKAFKSEGLFGDYKKLATIDSLASSDSLMLKDSLSAGQDTMRPLENNLKPQNRKNNPTTSRFFLDATFMIENSFRRLSSNGSGGQEVVDSKNNNESASQFFSYSIVLNYLFSKHFYAGIGLELLHTGLKGKSVKYIYDSHRFEGPEDRVTLVQTTFKETWTYLGVPVCFGYLYAKKRWTLGLHAAISISKNISYSKKIITKLDEEIMLRRNPRDQAPEVAAPTETKEIDPAYNNVYVLSYKLGLQVNYRIFHGLSLFISPYYRGFMSSVYNNNALVSQKPWGMGAAGGLRYNF